MRKPIEKAGISLLLGLALLLGGCSSSIDNDTSSMPYRLGAPEKVFELPDALKEVSGLSWKGSNHVLAINDEQGIIYDYDLVADTLYQNLPFGDGRDYEGIAGLDRDAYLMASDGELIQVKNYASMEERATTKFSTGLKPFNDVEGLCFWKEKGVFLMACKGGPGSGLSGQKAIYAYDTQASRLKPQDPLITLDLSMIEDSLFTNPLDQMGHNLRKILASDADYQEIFSPSGIAVHPLSGRIYVISAYYKLLVILDENQAIRKVARLSHPLFHQPEGITFNKEGTLFISNEGKGGNPNILQFKLSFGQPII